MIRLMLLCLVVFALLIGGSVLVGRAQPRPEFFGYFGSCSGAPCYIDIVPGQTRWTEIEARFEIVTDLRGDTEINLAYAPPGFIGTLRFYPAANGLLREVDLRFHGTRLKLGDFLTQLGTPCGVAITRRLPAVLYPGVGVLVGSERIGEMYAFTPTSTVTGINLLDDQTCDIANSLTLHPWRGFGRYVS
jgi:hypothetical protein